MQQVPLELDRRIANSKRESHRPGEHARLVDGGAEEGVNGVLYAHNANAYEKDADAAEDSEGVFVGGAPVPHQRPPLDENRYDDEIEIADDELHREKIIPMRREEDLRYDDHNARDEDPYAQPRDIY